MPYCQIVQDDIEDDECKSISIESEKSGKVIIPNKVKRVVCWKGICKSCKHHIKEKTK